MLSTANTDFSAQYRTRKVYHKGAIVGEIVCINHVWLVNWQEQTLRGSARVEEALAIANAVDRMAPKVDHGCW